MKDKKVVIGLPETVPIPRKKLPGRMKRRAQSTEKMLTRRLAMKAFPYCVNPAKIVRTEKGSFLRILRDRPDKDTLKAPAVRKVYNASAEAMRPNVVMPAAGEGLHRRQHVGNHLRSRASFGCQHAVQLRGLRHVTVQLDDDSGNCGEKRIDQHERQKAKPLARQLFFAIRFISPMVKIGIVAVRYWFMKSLLYCN